MFEKSIEQATEYTKPFITSIQYFDGQAESTCTSCIVLGDSGYILATASAVEVKRVAEIHEKDLAAYQSERAAIEADASLNDKLKRKKIGKLAPERSWVTKFAFRVQDVVLDVEQIVEHASVDLALLKVRNAKDLGVAVKPLFLQSETVQGAPVCKLGFAFHYLPTQVTEQGLAIDQTALPVPTLPLDGMVTRTIASKVEGASGVSFIETTGGALRSHGGAPVVNAEGQLIGVQSFVQPYPTGFNPKVGENSLPQFLNLAWAISGRTVEGFLKEHGAI